MVRCSADPKREEARALSAARAFAPRDLLVLTPWHLLHEVRDCDRLDVFVDESRGCLAALARFSRRPARIATGWPDQMRAVDAQDIVEPTCIESLTKLPRVAVASVAQDDVLSNAPSQRVVDLQQRDLPLAEKSNVLGNTCCLSRVAIASPGLRQVEPERDAATA